MNRQKRDRYDRDDYRNDYGGDAGYNRGDRHYHSARNLTNEFEQEYQHSGGNWGNDRDRDIEPSHDRDRHRPHRSYHEGNTMGDTYERLREGRGAVRSDSSYDFIYSGRDDDRSSRYERDQDLYSTSHSSYGAHRRHHTNYPEDSRRGQERYSHMDNRRGDFGSRNHDDIRRGYGISEFEGTSDRYNTLNNDQNRGGDYYSRPGMGDRGSRFGGSSRGESYPSSNRGMPDTTYGHRNFSDREGTGMGSTYGGQNYGGGTGYSGEEHGGSFGSSTYGTSAGNYGGYGSMGSNTYGGRGRRD